MSDHLTPEQAQALLDRMTLEVVCGEMDRGLAGEVGTFIRAQAAEIARLTAKVEAGERLAEACRGLHPIDTWGTPLGAALKAYEEAGK